MPVTLREFAYFIQEFVNQNFIPHLKTGRYEHQKSLQRWRYVSDIIRDLQKVNIWNLEQCLKKLETPKNFESDKESSQNKKYQNSKARPISFNMEYIFYHKKDTLPTTFLQEEVRIQHSLKDNSKQNADSCSKTNKYGRLVKQTKSSFQTQVGTQKTDLHANAQGFDKLISSFRRLCTSFDGNHKRLLKQDQKYKKNDKEQLLQQ